MGEEIKSALEIAMEKVEKLGEVTEEERLKWKYVPEGEILAARYLKQGCNLVVELSQYEEPARKYVIEGTGDILVRNINLPKNDLAKGNNRRAMDGIKNLKNDKVAVENVYSKMRRIFNHYVEQGEQQRKQAYESLKAEFEGRFPVVAVLAKEGTGLEELKTRVYEVLDIIRVYTKVPGKKPDFTDPIVVDRGSTLADAAAEVHKDFAANMKYARIWGSGKHDGVMARRDHVLEDGDIIELHL